MIFATFLKLYFLLGLILGIYFLFAGYKRILPDAAGTRFGVRILWVPAAVAIWPLILKKTFSGEHHS